MQARRDLVRSFGFEENLERHADSSHKLAGLGRFSARMLAQKGVYSLSQLLESFELKGTTWLMGISDSENWKRNVMKHLGPALDDMLHQRRPASLLQLEIPSSAPGVVTDEIVRLQQRISQLEQMIVVPASKPAATAPPPPATK